LAVNATAYGAPPGGAGLRARHLFGALRGHELLFLLAEDTPEELVPPGAAARRLPVLASRPKERFRTLRLPEEGDLLFTDHYPIARTPTILTLHDRGGGALRRWMIRRQFRRARGIVAVSEFLRERWGRPDAVVVPNGFTPPQAPLAPPPSPRPFLLFCDPALPHKGAARARAMARRAGMTLLEVGRGARWLPQQELWSLMAGAAAVLCPAEEEGFGMTALEAMALGRPVVASDIPAHREVLGDVAFYGEDLEGALAAPAERLRRGVERARSYRWEAAARRLEAALSLWR